MRAQTSLEAIALFAFATLILTLFMLYFGTQIASQAEEREFESLRDLSGMIRQEILLARQAGPGYERTLIIPRPGSNREVIFTIEYPPGPGSTEMTVRFEPALNEALEAVEVLGEGVYGYFSMGTNTIRTQEGGIIVEPDPSVMSDLFNEGIIDDWPTPEIAFAHLSADTVRLIDTIECEYGVSNHWAHNEDAAQHLDIAWISRDESDEQCYEEEIEYGDRAFLDSNWGELLKGRNLSCAARYRQGSATTLCGVLDGSGHDGGIRVARSSEALIINSPPIITVRSKHALSGVPGPDADNTIWENINVEFIVNDIDQEDTHFNVSLVKDGTNANFIECIECAWDGLAKGDTVTARFDLTVPWPAGGGCNDINRLSFRLRAIEADSTSELYTLKTVELDNELSC